MPAHLNRKQQREIKAVVERAKKDNGIPQTAQQSIPFQRMFPDGICRVTDNYYTKTIQYQDINYQLAQQEDKTAIFDEWCSFLNFFDSSIHFELSFMNMGTDAESFEKSVRIPFQKDEFNPVRAEYSQMLKKQLSQGNNGLTKTKYLTFGIEAESMRQAKPRLAHIENDLLNNFRRLGVVATPMDGKERLRLMHAMFHMGDDDKFFFDWKWLVESGLSVKDFIAPTAFAFKNNRTFQMGSLYGSMSFLSISASDLSDRMLADFLDMESSQIVTIHIQSVDQTAAIKTIKRTITELDRSKIEEQKKAVRSGYDMDIIPSDLATYGRDAKALLKELQSQNERMFMVTFLVMNTGRTEQELENNVFQAQSMHQYYNMATMINADVHRLFPSIDITMKTRLNSRADLSKERPPTLKGAMDEYFYQKYGESKQVRYINGMIVVPVAYCRTQNPMFFQVDTNRYTPQGRERIHRMLAKSKYGETLLKLSRDNDTKHSIEFCDNRLSRFVASKGKCELSKVSLAFEDVECIYLNPPSQGGTDEYANLRIVHKDIKRLIYSTDVKIIKSLIDLFDCRAPAKIAKLNKWRAKAGLEAVNLITINQTLK